jgi:hypothetical protein
MLLFESNASDPLWLVLLVGGGLGLVATLAGALVTQWNATRLDAEARKEARRMAVKTFQRDALVALQQAALDLQARTDALRRAEGSDGEPAAEDARQVARLQVAMFASRVRDEDLRQGVRDLLDSEDFVFKSRKTGDRIIPAAVIRQRMRATHMIYDRAGELIRTLDELDEAG